MKKPDKPLTEGNKKNIQKPNMKPPPRPQSPPPSREPKDKK